MGINGNDVGTQGNTQGNEDARGHVEYTRVGISANH